MMYGSIPLVSIPTGPTPGICHFFLFLLGGLFPTPGTKEETFPRLRDSPLVTRCTRTQKRNKAAFVYKIKITRFISVQNHTINIPETHAVDRTSIPKPLFHLSPPQGGARKPAYFFEDIAVPGDGANHMSIRPSLRMASTKT